AQTACGPIGPLSPSRTRATGVEVVASRETPQVVQTAAAPLADPAIARTTSELDAAIRANPDDPQAYLNRGSFRFSVLGDYRGAIEDYSKVLEGWSDNPAVHTARGAAHVKLDEYREAVPDFSAAIQRAPDYAEPYLHRGAAYLALGDRPQAISDLET